VLAISWQVLASVRKAGRLYTHDSGFRTQSPNKEVWFRSPRIRTRSPDSCGSIRLNRAGDYVDHFATRSAFFFFAQRCTTENANRYVENR